MTSTFLCRKRVELLTILFAALLLVSCGSGDSSGNAATSSFAAIGGFMEKNGSAVRPRWSASQIQSFVPPTRGSFTFPAPYNSQAIRITDASDCAGGQDCVVNVGYSYWLNTNAHTGSDTMWIFLGMLSNNGGDGPTLFQYNKVTDTISKVGPLFPAGSNWRSYDTVGWYFSASQPNKIYLNDPTKAYRFDVVTKQFDPVYDIGPQFGTGRYIWQMHSSNDDLVHSATLRETGTDQPLGCFVYNESTKQFSYFAKMGDFDECHIDRSGRFLLIQENLNSNPDDENVIIDLQTGTQNIIYDQAGRALGHHDMGYGYMIGGNGNDPLGRPNTQILWNLPSPPTLGQTFFYNIDWSVSVFGHISHTNAKPNVSPDKQFACGSFADRNMWMQNEITCARLDTSYDQLVVAPIMTNLDAAGGCCAGDYSKEPKGNLDVEGHYFIWTSNLGGNRLDAFLVKVPSQLLIGG